MSIHVCSCMHHGVGEWHLRYPGMSQEAAQGIADKINSGMLGGKQADRIAALEADLARVTAERDAITELNQAQFLALENCRLLAARNRNEEWAQNILRFCDEAGVRAVTMRQVKAALAKGE